jgi:hypothetical protein
MHGKIYRYSTGGAPPFLSCFCLLGNFFFVVEANFSTNLPVFFPWFVIAFGIGQKKLPEIDTIVCCCITFFQKY